MTPRNYTPVDIIFLLADDALTTLCGRPRSTGRENPAGHTDEAMLSNDEQEVSARLMRVNHTGEICAQALYRSQALTARTESVKNNMIQAAREENDHLIWCEDRIRALGGRKSLLNPLWYLGAFSIGSIAGLIGDRWNLGFLAETELQVEKHLEGHLEHLPKADSRSRAVVRQMKEDEASHATIALRAGAAELPDFVKQLMQVASRVMTAIAHRI